MSIYQKLAKVQKELKAPKNQYNSFGKYHYRSCEDILEGLKHVLGDLVVTLNDDIVMVGDRIYVKATVTVTDGKESISTCAFARESLTKKGMDDSQITGTASSYSRKYALDGMFLIDDTKDADSADNSQQSNKPISTDEKPWYNSFDQHKASMIEKIQAGTAPQQIINSLCDKYKVSNSVKDQIKGLQS